MVFEYDLDDILKEFNDDSNQINDDELIIDSEFDNINEGEISCLTKVDLQMN